MLTVRPGAAELRRRLADHDSAALVAELPLGSLAPTDALQALGHPLGGFLLESADRGAEGRWSFVAGAPARQLSIAEGDPLAPLRDSVCGRGLARPEGVDAPFLGGAVGCIAYEAARAYERVPSAPAAGPVPMPNAWFGVHDRVVIFDHAAERLLLCACVHREQVQPGQVETAHAAAVAGLERLQRALGGARPGRTARAETAVPDSDADTDSAQLERSASLSRLEFHAAVERCREHILAGDIFQVQVSRRFALPLRASPLTLYRELRSVNPSPYMFLLAAPGVTLAGASPEMLVRVRGDRVQHHPIAGTRRRGHSPEADARMEAQLRGSEKEAAEHLMLVDLGRNDVGRVCRPGSVRVTQMMEVERYSHVMHLVSTVEGRLAPGCTSLDALRACFPAGTVTGAPKVRAMEIIAGVEPEQRGAYAGAVGYAGYGGDLDMAIALRTIAVRGAVAYAQAAAGIVADSTAHEEALEIDNKVAALVRAIRLANAS